MGYSEMANKQDFDSQLHVIRLPTSQRLTVISEDARGHADEMIRKMMQCLKVLQRIEDMDVAYMLQAIIERFTGIEEFITKGTYKPSQKIHEIPYEGMEINWWLQKFSERILGHQRIVGQYGDLSTLNELYNRTKQRQKPSKQRISRPPDVVEPPRKVRKPSDDRMSTEEIRKGSEDQGSEDKVKTGKDEVGDSKKDEAKKDEVKKTKAKKEEAKTIEINPRDYTVDDTVFEELQYQCLETFHGIGNALQWRNIQTSGPMEKIRIDGRGSETPPASHQPIFGDGTSDYGFIF